MQVEREIVVTGLGVVSPIGIGRAAFQQSLYAATSGVRPVEWLTGTPFPVPIGAEVRDFDGKRYVQPRKAIKVMCREIQFGYAAAAMALEEASITSGKLEPDRFGVLFGSEMFYMDLPELEPAYRACVVDGRLDFSRWGTEGSAQFNPLWMLKFLPNMVACHLAISYDARGPNNTICLGDASPLLALIEAISVIQRDLADCMLIGGVGNRLSTTPLMYRRDTDLSHRLDDPEGASRPFDAERDGQVNGEGAGAFVIETRRHAEARGAKILARIRGSACGYDSPEVPGGPTGAGVQRTIRQALQRASVEPSQLGMVKAHGLSTVVHDRCEAQAIRATVGDVPVTAPKSLFGNLGTGGAAVELVATLIALEQQLIPATRNYRTPDPACPVRVVHSEPQPCATPAALVLSQSITGQTAAVVIDRV